MQKKRMSFAILMILVIIVISMSVLTIRMHAKDDIGYKYFSFPVAATEHGKIYISSNTALDTFCSGMGTDGLSWDTAHVIENYEIDAGGDGDGMWIMNIDRFLILRNLTVINSGGGYFAESAGIKLIDCTNVKITNCDVNNNEIGLLVWRSANIFLSDNTAMYNDLYGIFLRERANYITVTGNNASHNGGHGIMIKASEHNTIAGNNVSCNGNYGVSVNFMSDNNEIYDNIFCDNTKGAYEDDGDNNDIHDNSGCSAAVPTLPGYPLVWILGFVVCGFTILFRNTLKKSKRKQ